ncbi:MAG TPA: AMP-binding protein, partial [Pseudonocardiaceae bacterium]|nr:AMP-binding protein [Pseudonocardiaceae bacterium]
MSAVWTSTNGVVLRDLVPAQIRRRWVEQGHCPGQDLHTLFTAQVRTHPQRTAVVDSHGALCYRDLEARVRAVAAGLAGSGLGPEDVIGVAVPNGWRAVAAELAVTAVGAVALPYPDRQGRRDTLRLLTRSRASAVITVGAAAAELVAIRGELPFLRTVFVFGDVPAGSVAADRAPGGWRSLDELLPPRRRPDFPAGWPAAKVDPEAPARVLLSSGTEAEPKMVAYSHNAMAGGRANYVAALHDGPEPMRNLVLVPLASSFGSLGSSVTLAALGGTLLLLDGFDAGAALRMITREQPTHVFGVPTMLRRMAEHPPVPDEDTSALRALVSSGAPLQPDAARACARRFGQEVINVYGSADGVNCHTGRMRGMSAGTSCVGIPDPRVADIRIVGSGGRDLSAGHAGEIWARGPMT